MIKSTLKVYKSKGNWRWNVKDRNGKIIAASSEGYKRRKDCLANIDRLGTILCAGWFDVCASKGEVEKEVNW
jgi:uncharacterized protein YegP (UPF0339 family)